MQQLDDAAEGPQVGAFFDLDRTLIAGYSALAFGRDLVRSGHLHWWMLQSELFEAANAMREKSGDGYTAAMSVLGSLLVGVREAALVEIGESLFEKEYERRLHPEAFELIEAHRARGHTLIVASAATIYQTQPIARALGVRDVLCTRFEAFAGRLTGRVESACWGVGKLEAARALAEERNIDLAESFFYSDGAEDLPLLEAVGRPRPTNPDETLEQVASERGWSVRHFGEREAATVWELAQPLLERQPRQNLKQAVERAFDGQIRMGYRMALWMHRALRAPNTENSRRR